MFSFNVDAFHRIELLTFVETNGSLNCWHYKEMNRNKRGCFPLEVNLILKLVA